MQIGDEALQQATALAEERDKLRTHRESAALGLSEGLLCLQAEGLLCDVQLIPSGGAAVHAHKAVLAAASGYFRALFTGPWSASRERLTVDLPDVEQAVLQLVVSVRRTVLIKGLNEEPTLDCAQYHSVCRFCTRIAQWPSASCCSQRLSRL